MKIDKFLIKKFGKKLKGNKSPPSIDHVIKGEKRWLKIFIYFNTDRTLWKFNFGHFDLLHCHHKKFKTGAKKQTSQIYIHVSVVSSWMNDLICFKPVLSTLVKMKEEHLNFKNFIVPDGYPEYSSWQREETTHSRNTRSFHTCSKQP